VVAAEKPIEDDGCWTAAAEKPIENDSCWVVVEKLEEDAEFSISPRS